MENMLIVEDIDEKEEKIRRQKEEEDEEFKANILKKSNMSMNKEFGTKETPRTAYTQQELMEKRDSNDYINDNKIANKNEPILKKSKTKIIKITKLEYIQNYHDEYPLLKMRIKIWIFKHLITERCLKFISTNFFEYLTLGVIICDTVILSLYDVQEDTAPIPDFVGYMFLGYYILEMLLKITGLGLIFPRNAYLRDAWNIMDFIIIIAACIPIFYGNQGISLTGLRLLRLLRPLRTISVLKSLRIIVKTLLETLPYIRDIICIAILSIFLFSIVGLQLFMGLLKYRCMDVNTGIPIYNSDFPEINNQQYCGYLSCTTDLSTTNTNVACAKMIADPNYGVTNFGTILWSMLNVYQITTQEGWSSILYMLMLTLHPIVIIYFILCLLINSYYFLNLIMAVITAIFTINCRQESELFKEKHQLTYDEIIMNFIKEHKSKVIELINNHQAGKLESHKIQFIHGKLYLYKQNIPKIKKTYSEITKTFWNKLLKKITEKREQNSKTSKRNKLKKNKKGNLLSNTSKLKNIGHRLRIGHLKLLKAQSQVYANMRNKDSSKLHQKIQSENKAIYKNEFEPKQSKQQPKSKISSIHSISTDLKSNNSLNKLVPRFKKLESNSLALIKKELCLDSLKINENHKQKQQKQNHDYDSPIKTRFDTETPLNFGKSEINLDKTNHYSQTMGSSLFLKDNNGLDDKSDLSFKRRNKSQLIDKNNISLILDDKPSTDPSPNYFKRSLSRARTYYPKSISGINFKYKNVRGALRSNSFRIQRRQTMILKKSCTLRTKTGKNQPSQACTNLCKNSNSDNIDSAREVEEYTGDDLNKLKIGKDRFIIDLRYLKVEHDDKEDNLEDQILVLKDMAIRPKTNIEWDKYLNSRLYQIYNTEENIIQNGKKPRTKIFALPIQHDINKALGYNNHIKKFSLFNYLHNERANAKKKKSKKMEEDENRRKRKEKNSNFKNIADINKNIRFTKIFDAEVDMNYIPISHQLNDDLKINIHKILDHQAIEYFNADEEYLSIRESDHIHKSVRIRNWSVHEILSQEYDRSYMNKIKLQLMQKYESIWELGYIGLVQAIRRKIRKFCEGNLFSNLILMAVFINLIFLAGIGILPNDDDNHKSSIVNRSNPIFTLLFLMEMVLKLIGMGPIDYFRDALNVIDGTSVILSIVEYTSESGPHTFSVFRIIRIFRVLRMTKLFKALEFMRLLIIVVSKALKDFLCILMLIILFLYIYTLLGMQLLGGELEYPDNIGWGKIRNNFDTFSIAIITVFQIMTSENWNSIMVIIERSSVGYLTTTIYMISWIIISNYILLNLLVAILLSQFEDGTIDEENYELDDLNEEGDDIELLLGVVVPPKLHFTLTDANLIDKPKFNNYEQQINNNQRLSPNEPIKIKFTDDNSIDGLETFVMYEGNFCEKSLYIFKKSWRIRQLLYRFSKNKWFDGCVLFIIIISALKLAIDTYIDPHDPHMAYMNEISDDTQYILSGLFFIEALIKIISLGFMSNKGCYLRDKWNILDFLILVLGFIDISFTNVNIGFIRVLRLLRILRPLRLVTHNKTLRLIITAIMESMSGILNVMLVILLMLLVFAILGVGLLRNKLGVCDVSGNPNLNRYGINYDTCQWLGYNWMTWSMNWDNVFNGMLSLFVLSTQEGWPDYMFQCADANSSDVGPIENNNLGIFIYFAVFLLVCSYFLINLFVGVILYEYAKAEKKEKVKYLFLTKEQETWIQIQKMLLDVHLDIIPTPKNNYQKFWFNIVETKLFELVIILCIIANMIILSLYYDDSSLTYIQNLESINDLFTGVFIFEMFAKMSAAGIKMYFVNDWNKFDFFVVLTSIADITIENLKGFSSTLLRLGPQVVRVFRILRINRLFKLTKQFSNVQKLFQILVFSLPSVANIIGLVILIFYIYAILATYLFSNIVSGQLINSFINFSNFSQSIFSLYISSTGENWYLLMFDTFNPIECADTETDCSSNSVTSLIFWISFIIMIRYTMLNLLVMVLLDMFLDYLINDENATQNFSDNVENFKEIWKKFTKKDQNLAINNRLLVKFFLNLEEPLGFKESNKEIIIDNIKIKQIAKRIMELNVQMNLDGKVSFHYALFSAFKKAYCPMNRVKSKVRSILENVEFETMDKIQGMLHKSYKRLGIHIHHNHNNAHNNDHKHKPQSKKIHFNPLAQLLFANMALRAWKNYTKKVISYSHLRPPINNIHNEFTNHSDDNSSEDSKGNEGIDKCDEGVCPFDEGDAKLDECDGKFTGERNAKVEEEVNSDKFEEGEGGENTKSEEAKYQEEEDEEEGENAKSEKEQAIKLEKGDIEIEEIKFKFQDYFESQ